MSTISVVNKVFAWVERHKVLSLFFLLLLVAIFSKSDEKQLAVAEANKAHYAAEAKAQQAAKKAEQLELEKSGAEEGAVIGIGITSDVISGVVLMIVGSGYRCNSVSSIRHWLTGPGFSVSCNQFRYDYEIEDRGGNWVVQIDD